MFQLKETKMDQSKDEKEEKGLVSLENLTNSFKVSIHHCRNISTKSYLEGASKETGGQSASHCYSPCRRFYGEHIVG